MAEKTTQPPDKIIVEKRTASDAEIANFFIGHIEDPCKVDIGQGVIDNIRDFYIREARSVLPTFTDPIAKESLNSHIIKYQPNKDRE